MHLHDLQCAFSDTVVLNSQYYIATLYRCNRTKTYIEFSIRSTVTAIMATTLSFYQSFSLCVNSPLIVYASRDAASFQQRHKSVLAKRIFSTILYSAQFLRYSALLYGSRNSSLRKKEKILLNIPLYVLFK